MALESAKSYAALTSYNTSEVDNLFYLCLRMSSWNVSQCEAYMDSYYYTKYFELMFSLTQAYMFAVFSSLGLVGYIVQGVVQLDAEFKIVTFIYYNNMVALELLHMIFLLAFGLSSIIPLDQQSRASYEFSANISNSFNKILIMTTDFITLFICLERFIAILFPVQFNKINNKKVVWGAIMISLLSGFTFVLDFWRGSVIMASTGPKLVNDPDFLIKHANFIKFRDAYQGAKGYAVSILSVLVVFGLIRITKKKKSTQLSTDRDIIKKNMQICILSLLCGVPVTLNSLTYVWWSQFYATYISGNDAIMTLTYESALDQLSKAQVRAELLLVVNFFMCVAHCCHFYLNVTLSPMFRRVFLRKYRAIRGVTAIEPVNNKTLTTTT